MSEKERLDKFEKLVSDVPSNFIQKLNDYKTKKIVLGNDEIVYLNHAENRGGYRKGSGAKPRYNEPTKSISLRVPESKADEIKAMIKEYLEQFKTS